MGHVRDRWTDPNPDPGGRPKRLRNVRWGHGKRWQARWMENGREHVQACANKDEAELLVAEKDAGVVRRTTSTVTVEERMGVWKASKANRRPGTLATIDQSLNGLILPTLGALPVALLNREAGQAAVNEWAGRWSPSRVRLAWGYVAGMLLQAERDGLIERRPQGIVLPELPVDPVVPLTVAQVEHVQAKLSPWWRAAVTVAAASGVRPGELFGLTRDRLLEDCSVLMVDRQLVGHRGRVPVFGPPKTRWSVRRVSIGEDAAEVLREHLDRWGSEDLVFRTRHQTPVSRSRRAEMWREAAEGLALGEREGWHSLRHFHASLLISEGLSPTAVAHRLGHKDATETLRTYSHLWPTDDERALRIVGAQLASSSILARSPGGPG